MLQELKNKHNGRLNLYCSYRLIHSLGPVRSLPTKYWLTLYETRRLNVMGRVFLVCDKFLVSCPLQYAHDYLNAKLSCYVMPYSFVFP